MANLALDGFAGPAEPHGHMGRERNGISVLSLIESFSSSKECRNAILHLKPERTVGGRVETVWYTRTARGERLAEQGCHDLKGEPRRHSVLAVGHEGDAYAAMRVEKEVVLVAGMCAAMADEAVVADPRPCEAKPILGWASIEAQGRDRRIAAGRGHAAFGQVQLELPH